MQKRIISIVGGADSSSDVLTMAEAVGEEIARRGVALACGGLGGVMEAACHGAKKQGGSTIGILPTDAKDDANPYVDYAIPTGLGYSRNFLVAKAGDAVIAIGGSAGTLSEMAIAWFSDRPIVALVPSGGWAGRLAGQTLDDRRTDVIHPAQTAEEAVDIVFRVLGWK
ncbi:MAG: TIGR00725 family protein [Candidatus Thorarchaeota archaeon]|nr:MAG: TIGR00725 family protein [Candidatus Thorarchaeota archaeon]